MSLTRGAVQSDLSGEVLKLIAGCLGISVEEPKHTPMIRVEAMGSGAIITSINLDENEYATIGYLQHIVANLKKVHNTMIGFTDGHGGPIIDEAARYLSSFPKNTVFVSYVKNAKCRFRNRMVYTNECQIYNKYGVPLCLCCYDEYNHNKFARYARDNGGPWEDYVHYTISNMARNEYPEDYVHLKHLSVQLERPSVPIEQLLFGASYTSSPRRKTSKSQPIVWYNKNKPVNDSRVQKRTKKSHR